MFVEVEMEIQFKPKTYKWELYEARALDSNCCSSTHLFVSWKFFKQHHKLLQIEVNLIPGNTFQ